MKPLRIIGLLFLAVLAIGLLCELATSEAAAQRRTIETPTGQPLGYLETRGEITTAYTVSGQRLGYYDGRSNQTYTVNGRVIARGNIVVTLLPLRR